MIDRYSLPRMKAIWEPENKFQKWLDIEILAAEAQAEFGIVPRDAVAEIKAKASFNVARIGEIERRVEHDVIAFLTNVAEQVGPASRFVHYGLTSSDVVDTAESVLMREAAEILIEDAKDLTRTIKRRALEHKGTVMIGRTHGVHAEPTTFGVKLANWAFETDRNRVRLEDAKAVISYGKLSGAVGTYSNVDPRVEGRVCERLGLKPAPVSSQVLQRDRHAQYLGALAICASTIEKMATEVRALQRTELLEAEEPFKRGQKGSSAMPHKRNPILSERLCGLARVVRANAVVALENVALWHERDISHSSAERVIVPDSTILLDYMLVKLREIVDGLEVHPENMRANLERTGGLVFSSRVLLALVDKGVSREDAYGLVQSLAFQAGESLRTGGGGPSFKELVEADADIRKYLTEPEIAGCFDVAYFLRNTGVIFDRLEALEV